MLEGRLFELEYAQKRVLAGGFIWVWKCSKNVMEERSFEWEYDQTRCRMICSKNVLGGAFIWVGRWSNNVQEGCLFGIEYDKKKITCLEGRLFECEHAQETWRRGVYASLNIWQWSTFLTECYCWLLCYKKKGKAGGGERVGEGSGRGRGAWHGMVG